MKGKKLLGKNTEKQLSKKKQSRRKENHLFEEPLAALISSSAKHSAMVLMFLKAASRAPVVRRYKAWFTRLRGEISTA